MDEQTEQPREGAHTAMEFAAGLITVGLGTAFSVYAFRRNHVEGNSLVNGCTGALEALAAALIGGGIGLAHPTLMGQDWKTRTASGAAVGVLTNSILALTRNHRAK